MIGQQLVPTSWDEQIVAGPLDHLPEDDWRRVVTNPNVYLDSVGNPRTIGDGKPYVRVACPDAKEMPGGLLSVDGECVNGRVPGARGPTSRKCAKCNGRGFKASLFTRVTSFAGVLDDRTQVEQWRERIIATGYSVDPALLAEFRAVDQSDLHDLDPDVVTACKQRLNELNRRAFDVGDFVQAAQKGTDLHKLAEHADRGESLPQVLTGDNGVTREVTLQDRADVMAWRRTLDVLDVDILDVERFVVCDDIGAAGTLDRRGHIRRTPRTGTWCDCGLPKIIDAKTGRVDYGGGKMSQQLAVYAHSDGYEPVTGARVALPSCTHVGVIIHLPHGTGSASVHTVDLTAGWETGIELARQVRAYRNESKRWIAPVDLDDLQEAL